MMNETDGLCQHELTAGPTTHTTFCSPFLWFAIAVIGGGCKWESERWGEVPQGLTLYTGSYCGCVSADSHLSSKVNLKKRCHLWNIFSAMPPHVLRLNPLPDDSEWRFTVPPDVLALPRNPKLGVVYGKGISFTAEKVTHNPD